MAAHAAHGRDWPGFLRLLKERPNACFQSNIGGTKNEEIFGGWLLVYEIDRYDKDKQFGLWEAAGLQWEADELRRKAGIAEMQRMNERIDESRQVQQQAAQRREEWQSMGILERMGHQPLSPEVISRNRREWGITGQ